MLYSRFFISLKPPLYVGLEVDTQQLNVPKVNVAYKYTYVNHVSIEQTRIDIWTEKSVAKVSQKVLK